MASNDSADLASQPQALNLAALSSEDQDLLRYATDRSGGMREGVAASGVDGNIPLNHHHGDGETLAHPVPLWLLLGTFGVLMVLTFATVAVTLVDLGPANIWIALIIAAVKAAFVAIIFMHLRWDNPFNGVALLASLFFLVIFIGVALLDTGEYNNLKRPPGGYDVPREAAP